MKKILMNFMLTLLSISCFSQQDNKVISDWLSVDGAKGLKFKVINYNYNNTNGEYYWGIIAKNNYSQPVSFKYKLVIGGVQYAKGYYSNVYNLRSGAEFKDGNSLVTALLFKTNSLEYDIEIKDFELINNTIYEGKNNNIYINTEELNTYDFVDEMPAFPGGEGKLNSFIANNIKYPRDAIDNDIQGKVVVSFIVMKDGSITSVMVKTGVSSELDTEAIRVVSNLPKFIPGKLKGKPVNVNYTLPVVFRLQ